MADLVSMPPEQVMNISQFCNEISGQHILLIRKYLQNHGPATIKWLIKNKVLKNNNTET